MSLDPTVPPSGDKTHSAGAPPLLRASEPPVIGVPLPSGAGFYLPSKPVPQRSLPRSLLLVVLNLCLGLFLADAIVSVLDDSLILFFDIHVLTMIRGLVFVFAILVSIVVYVLMALTPMIP